MRISRPHDRKGLIALDEALKSILAIASIAFFVGLLFPTLASVFSSSSPEEQGAIKQFIALGTSIQYLLDSSDDFDYYGTHLYVPENYVLVAYDTDWPLLSLSHVQEGDTGGPLLKPTSCGQKACICLYKDGIEENEQNKKDDNLALPCITFDKDITFLSRYQDDAKPRMCGTNRLLTLPGLGEPLRSGPYGYFIVYGNKCGTWNAQQLYLEKLTSSTPNGDQIYIYGAIADGHERDRIKELITNMPATTSTTVNMGSLVSIQGIPGIECDETKTDFGKICQAFPQVRTALESISKAFQDPASPWYQHRMEITQAFRTWQIQNALYQCYQTQTHNGKPYKCALACYPGTITNQRQCPHMAGGAVDIIIYDPAGRSVNDLEPGKVEALMCSLGFVRYHGEAWHFEMGTFQWQKAVDLRRQGQLACSY